MLDMFSAHQMMKKGRTAEVHAEIDRLTGVVTGEDYILLNHIRTHAFLHERRFADALDHLDRCRNFYGCETLVHQTKAMIFEVLDDDSAALRELETAPYDRESDQYPLLVSDAYFYMAYFKLIRNLYIDIDFVKNKYADDFGTYLPNQGKMRGIHISKSDLIKLYEKSNQI